MIVLNGEPFTRFNLRSLYPFAHQIIVVEGACRAAAAVATPDGHSIDGTLNVLREFQQRKDPEKKITIVTAVDEGYADGFWPEKDEMSQAYARRATGNYLWQVDSDEFYHEEQLTRLTALLERKSPDTVSFPMICFWGGLDYVADSFNLIRDNTSEYHRLFAWGPDYTYKTHRPPTVLDGDGIDLRKKVWWQSRELKKMGIFLYHYSLLFPHQVFNKVSYYTSRDQESTYSSWEDSVYRRLERPFRVHNACQHIGWLRRFSGEHPSIVRDMMADIADGRLHITQRDCSDVEQLLSKRRYLAATRILDCCAQFMAIQPNQSLYKVYASLRARIRRFLNLTDTYLA
jgi:hypothetical protein